MSTAPLPMDWHVWREQWAEWQRRNGDLLQPTTARFGAKNIAADAILTVAEIHGHVVEFSEVRMPALDGPDRVRYIGLTYRICGTRVDTSETELVATFAELDAFLESLQ